MHSTTIFYVATMASYVLVASTNATEAQALGTAALTELYRERCGREIAINVKTVRHATTEEIEDQRWHAEMLARESSTAN